MERSLSNGDLMSTSIEKNIAQHPTIDVDQTSVMLAVVMNRQYRSKPRRTHRCKQCGRLLLGLIE